MGAAIVGTEAGATGGSNPPAPSGALGGIANAAFTSSSTDQT